MLVVVVSTVMTSPLWPLISVPLQTKPFMLHGFQTEQSFLHIYKIVPQGNDGASYQLTNSKSYALGPGEGIGFPDLTIKFKMTIKMDAGVSRYDKHPHPLGRPW